MVKSGIKAIPASALAELALIRFAEKGVIKYVRGFSTFEIIREDMLSKREKMLLEKIDELLKKWGSTGVQKAINYAIFDVGKMIAAFPVEDENKLTDHKGNVLPDVFLIPEGTTAKEFAGMIHTDLAETFIYALDVRTKRKLSADYRLKHRDVIKIYAAARKKCS